MAGLASTRDFLTNDTHRMPETPIPPQEVVFAIDHVANKLEAGDRSFGLQEGLMRIQHGLLAMREFPAAQTVNVIAMQLLPRSAMIDKYTAEGAQRLIDSLPPFDTTRDVAILRKLALGLRTRERTPSQDAIATQPVFPAGAFRFPRFDRDRR